MTYVNRPDRIPPNHEVIFPLPPTPPRPHGPGPCSSSVENGCWCRGYIP